MASNHNALAGMNPTLLKITHCLLQALLRWQINTLEAAKKTIVVTGLSSKIKISFYGPT